MATLRPPAKRFEGYHPDTIDTPGLDETVIAPLPSRRRERILGAVLLVVLFVSLWVTLVPDFHNYYIPGLVSGSIGLFILAYHWI